MFLNVIKSISYSRYPLEILTQVHVFIPRVEDRINISGRQARHDGIEMIVRAQADDVAGFDSLLLEP
jgi:hypothetical protein